MMRLNSPQDPRAMIETLKTDLENKIGALQRDVNEKHGQNRADIHKMNNASQLMLNNQAIMQNDLTSLVGTRDKEGIVERLEASLSDLGKTITTGLVRLEDKTNERIEASERRSVQVARELKIETEQNAKESNARIGKLEIQWARAAGYIAALGAVGGLVFELVRVAIDHVAK